MIIASQKKKENISEYLLYMWQIEDIIRANNLDIDKIEHNVIDKYTSLNNSEKKSMREWYESLIDMMRREGVVEKGHLQLNKNVIIELNDLHNRLLKENKFAAYNAEFYNVLPYIVEVRAKSGNDKPGEIESCFNALYGVLMLRLSGKQVSEQTTKAIVSISHFLAIIAAYYKKDRENKLWTDND